MAYRRKSAVSLLGCGLRGGRFIDAVRLALRGLTKLPEIAKLPEPLKKKR